MKNVFVLFSPKTLLLLALALGLASFSNLTDKPDLNVYLGEQLINGESASVDKIRTATFVSVKDRDGNLLKIKSFKLTCLIRKVGLLEVIRVHPWVVLSEVETKYLQGAEAGDLVQLTNIVVEDLSNADIKLADVYCTLQ